MDLDRRQHSSSSSGRSGRIILLGDGTEVLTDASDADAEMFDQSSDEEKDLESQVRKGQGQAAASEERGSREETPGPSSAADSEVTGTGPGKAPAEPKMKAVADTP